MKTVLCLILLAQAATAQNCVLQKDWKRAIWRVPLHIAMSVPVAVASFVVPPAGVAYVHWRQEAEHADETMQRDTAMKATIDLYSQTALVNAVLKIWGIGAVQ